jgi:hypothetical protein
MFGFGKFKVPPPAGPPEPYDPARALMELFKAKKRMIDGLIRPENLLSATAAVTGEFCIRVAGEFDPYHHNFFPGGTVASDKVDQLLFADQEDLKTLPESTIFGTIRDGALHRGYTAIDFPSLTDIVQRSVEGKTSDGDPALVRGRVPLSVSRDHLPKLSPLQEAYLLRELVSTQMSNWGVPLNDQAVTCARATALVLGYVRDVIDPKIALQIVFATVYGMAHMAPMTARHMAEMKLRVGKGRVVF